ncbi:MAG: UDP-glucose 4-epimerase GalE [Pseudomonadota bacterium]
MSERSILVTGGAGYIGSHVVRQLGERDETIVVLDNLSTGFADAVIAGQLITGDTGDADLLDELFAKYRFETVMHFAAHTVVPESVADPLKYYRNNTANSRTLLEACQKYGTSNVVFSSTAAVYGVVEDERASEDSPTKPINPYGSSKLMTEQMLRDLDIAGGPKHVILRYFNVAGSDPEGRIGQSTPNATLLTKVACEVAVGSRPQLKIFGTDYPTPDGTGIRDYIHVEDLASAHIAALDYLRHGGDSVTLNCGYGHGYSVREVIAAVERAHGAPLNVVETDRRPGDPPELVSVADKIRRVLGWEPQYDDLDAIVSSALRWERRLAERSCKAAS